MSIWAIIGIIIAVVSGLLGGIAGKTIGKSSGRKEGAERAKNDQQVTQAKAAVEAVQERSNVEQKNAVAPDADIDRELSEFSRPD